MLLSEVKSEKKPIKIPTWLIGVIVGIALGIATAWLDKTYLQSQSFSNGFIIALLSSLIGIVIDTRTLLEKRFEIDDRRSRLMKSLEECPFEEELLVQMLNPVVQIPTIDQNKYLHDRALIVISKCKTKLEDLSKSRYTLKQYSMELLIEFTENAKKSIYATSTDVDLLNLWRNTDGAKYLEKQISLINDHKVTIQRLFIITADTKSDTNKRKKLLDIMYNQRKEKIDVKWITSRAYFEEARNSDSNNFVIIDEWVHLDTVINEGEAIGMKIDFNPQTIRDSKNNFILQWGKGKPLEEL